MKWFRSFALLTILTLSLNITGLNAAQSVPFTIQAQENLQPALTALYAALYEGAPLFVANDGDVVATTDDSRIREASRQIAPHFLPDAIFMLQTRNEAAAEFVRFAVSPDGQQALIEAGFLPDAVTITDQVGNTVTIPQPVRRVMTPYSLATYLVYGVGAADRLVAGGYLGARTPIGAARMEAIDPRFAELSAYAITQREINVEVVAELMPDVIFTSARTAWLDTVAELGIPVVLFQGESPELLKESMRIAGQVFGPDALARAQAWEVYYDSIFSQVLDQTSDLTLEQRPGVLMVGEEALRVISGEMYQTDIISAAGGRSVSANLAGFWNDVNLEQIILWDPDVIVIVPYGNVTPETLTASPEWQAVSAVQNGRVYKMPSWVAPWDAPVPDSALGIIWLAQALFPDRVTLDCANEAMYFFGAFYDHVIPEAEAAALCGD
jgi:iron complex transport system substrate-binding protein